MRWVENLTFWESSCGLLVTYDVGSGPWVCAVLGFGCVVAFWWHGVAVWEYHGFRLWQIGLDGGSRLDFEIS